MKISNHHNFPTSLFFVSVCILLLAACSPRFNWREVQPFEDAFQLQLPCKPDIASRPIPFNQQTLTIQMAGCEVDGMMFVTAKTQLQAGLSVEEVKQAWLFSLLQNIQLDAQAKAETPSRELPKKVQQNSLLSQEQVRSYLGVDHQKQAVRMEIFWLAKENKLTATSIDLTAPQASDSTRSSPTTPMTSPQGTGHDLYQVAVFYPSSAKVNKAQEQALHTFFLGLDFE